MVVVDLGWMAIVLDTGEMAYLNRQRDKLYPENSTTPVLQDLGATTTLHSSTFTKKFRLKGRYPVSPA